MYDLNKKKSIYKWRGDNLDKYREQQKKIYNKKYNDDDDFKEIEKMRKKKYYHENKEKILQRLKEKRDAERAKIEAENP